jgi:23S rRNA pseudouridine2605 synthase
VSGGPKPAERIAKRLARAGLCSRRKAEEWIRAGRVAVDGKVLDSPAITVTSDNVITVDGKPVPEAEPTRLWRYHKPTGLVTTTRDPQGRPTVFDKLPTAMPRVISVGRLDINSEGLLLLTNDGEVARRLELPATGWLRRYRVRVRGRVDVTKLEALEAGIEIDGMRYGPVRARLDRQLATNAWLTIALAEGKNREVRRVCEHLGWPVLRLIRLSYGPFQLGNLARGAVAEVPARILREQLGSGANETQGPGQSKAKKPYRGKKGGGRTPDREGSTPTRPLSHKGGRGKKARLAKVQPSAPAGEARVREMAPAGGGAKKTGPGSSKLHAHRRRKT